MLPYYWEKSSPLLPGFVQQRKKAARRRPFSPLAAAAAAVFGLLIVQGAGGLAVVGGEELAHGEADLAEQLAGVLLVAAAVTAAVAVLLRHAVVVGGHEQLGVPLQTDDGELAQGDEQAVRVAAGDQLVGEAGAHLGRDLAAGTGAGAALAYVHQLHAQDDGVHRLHYPHQIGKAIKVYPNHRAFSGLYAHFRPY